MKPDFAGLIALGTIVASCSTTQGASGIGVGKTALSAAQVETIAYARQLALKYSKNGSDACYNYSIETGKNVTVAVWSDFHAVAGAIVPICGPSFYIIRTDNGPFLEVPMR